MYSLLKKFFFLPSLPSDSVNGSVLQPNSNSFSHIPRLYQSYSTFIMQSCSHVMPCCHVMLSCSQLVENYREKRALSAIVVLIRKRLQLKNVHLLTFPSHWITMRRIYTTRSPRVSYSKVLKRLYHSIECRRSTCMFYTISVYPKLRSLSVYHFVP